MPSVMEAPERVQDEQTYQDMPDRPSEQPAQRFLAALRRVIRTVVRRGEVSRRIAPEMPLDMLARQHPYHYIHAISG